MSRTRLSPPKRKIELMLLVAVQVVVLCGLALVFFGKRATTALPPNAVNINTAAAAPLAQALSVSEAQARKIVAARGHAFSSVYALKRTLKGVTTGDVDDRFVARTPGDVRRAFSVGVAVFVLAFFLAHALLRKAAPDADPFLLPLIALLSGVGLMMVYTVKDPYRDTFVFTGQVWGVALYGLIALVIPLTRPFGRIPLRRYQYAYAVAAVGLMVLLLVAGHGPGGIHLSVLGFQPIEIIKVLLILFVASYLAERRGLGDATRTAPGVRDFGPLAAIYLFALLLFVLVKDLGPAVLLFGTFLTLLYLTTQRAIYPVVGASLLLIAGVVGYHLHFGFFATRVVMWLNPWSNPDPRGAQLAQGLWGMATGGLWGSGLGLGNPQFMPRAGSDLVFATVGEEMGLFGTVSLLIVYVVLMVRGFRIALCAVTDFDRLLAAGLTTLLTLQTMIIVGGVTGLVPLTGITLPFVSFGASSLVSDFFAIGLLLSISNRTLPTTVSDRATPAWSRAARRVAFGGAAYLLLGVGLLRLFWVQGIADTPLATRPLITPDADGVARAHINPRLLAYAAAIPRGRILDRNGVVLARDSSASDTGTTGLLVPDGRPRVYPAEASACAHLLMAVEAPAGPQNSLGQNVRLRGFETYTALLSSYRKQYLPLARRPHGQDVTLTIDGGVQQAALDALRTYAGQVRDRRTGRPKDRGAAVALNAATGEVLAAVSLPTFDPATLTPEGWAKLKAGLDRQDTLLNRAVSGLYPPGSAFKIVTAAAGLQHGLGGTTITCRHADFNVRWTFAGTHYSRARITDEEGFVPHGVTDMAKALRVSCNVYFAHLGIDLGAPALDGTARQQFGLAHLPSLQKLGEDLPDCAYGQGAVLVTPLEMARVAQAVANNGQMHAPTFVKSSHTGAAVTALPAAQAAQLQPMLAAVTTSGTAAGVFNGLPVSVAGKTGSAQNNQGDGMTHSWFAGFAPATNPTLAFACVIENGGAGRAAAAPVCREIVRKVFQ